VRRHATWLLVAGTVAGALSVTGCNATRRELSIVFTPAATDAQRLAAWRACTGAAPHTSPEPIPTPSGSRGIERQGPLVRFRIDSADDQDIARLEECLGKQPGVQGFQDSSS
jgi:hypothetical protein